MSFGKFTQQLLLLFMGLAAIPSTWAQTYTVLYSFTGGTDGAFPSTGVIQDSAGNLYGTSAGVLTGTVFELRPEGRFTLLQSFAVPEGIYDYPFSALVRDSADNLYGTIYYGGAFNRGDVYKITKRDKFSVLYNFPSTWEVNGYETLDPLILDSASNLYGAGGAVVCDDRPGDCGLIFKLDPSGNETTLHAFSRPRYGDLPNGGLIRDAAGNLYGTTMSGGHGGDGIVFELDPDGTETVLYTFRGKPDGSEPHAGLIQDSAGNFYGTTVLGGNRGCESSCGVIFKLDINGDETVLYAFTGKSDGGNPTGPLVMDSAGNLYGTAGYGTLSGGSQGHGVVFELEPSGQETVLYTFTGGTDGGGPSGGLSMDSAENLYGTTLVGGNLNDCTAGGGAGCGVVFKITP